MANLTELAPRDVPSEDPNPFESVQFLKPAIRFRELERVNQDYFLSSLAIESQTTLTQSFLRHSRILHESLFDHEDVSLDTSPPQFQSSTEDAGTGRVIVFERYFPLSYQYFTLYTPDSDRSKYTDTDFRIGPLLTPNLIRKRFMDLQNTNSPTAVPGIHSVSSSVERDGNTFLSLQTVSPYSHISVERMDRVVNSLQRELEQRSDHSAGAITHREYQHQRSRVEELTQELRITSGKQSASALRDFLTSLNEYRKNGHDIPPVISYSSEDEMIDVTVSIAHQQMDVITPTQEIVSTLSGDDDERTAEFTGEITRLLLPYLQKLTHAKRGDERRKIPA